MTAAVEDLPVTWTVLALAIFGATLAILELVSNGSASSNAKVELGALLFVPLATSFLASLVLTACWLNYAAHSLPAAFKARIAAHPARIPDYARIAQLEAEIYPDEFTTSEKLRHVRQGHLERDGCHVQPLGHGNRQLHAPGARAADRLNQQIDQLDRRIHHVVQVEQRSRG